MSVLVHNLLDGELVEVLRLVVSDLLSIHGECLGEITVTVEETDGCHIHPAVGGFFDVVAGKHSKAARINLKGVAKTIFHREVGHGGDVLTHGSLHIFFKMGVDGFDSGHH